MKTANTPASTSATIPSTHANGIDREALLASIDAIRDQPANGMTTWSVRSQWMGGTRTDHHVDHLDIGSQRIHRPFTIRIDEPEQLCGTNQFANPQEYLLSAINACMMVGYAAVATLMGIKLESLEVETTGDIDLRGFLAIDPTIRNGYPEIHQTIRIAADATEQQLNELHRAVLATSPNFEHITRAVPMKPRLEIVER
ncbi:MAG: OsmC family protein [Phycisphaerales bacterium]